VGVDKGHACRCAGDALLARLRHPAGCPAKLWKEAMDICALGFGLVAVVLLLTGHTSPIFLDLFVLRFCATEGEF
jgi:hypothetical protein